MIRWQGANSVSQHDREPTVEEILASIKKVMSQDARDMRGLDEDNAAAASDDDLDDGSDPILELTQQVEQREELISQSAGDAVRQSLAALSAVSEPRAKPQIVKSGETSLEELVREAIRPMLKDWIDCNLPTMVERIVTDEIRRINNRG